MSAHTDYSHGEVIANKYVVEGVAGESPAAITYLANGNAGRLAVKIYRPEISAKLMAAPDFFLKAVIMTEIGHDNLAACLDVQEEMGRVFVARSFVEGEAFEDWARKRRGEPGHFARGLELLWQVCQGLGAMHERTRHLNIHPGNVIVGPVVAKLCDPDPRALGNTEMTPDPLPLRPEYRGYRAPEMAGRGAGFLSYPSSDLFAIAGLLYRLVKGEHPSSNPAQTLTDARAIDRDLALFLGKALHPKPEERFQDAGAFADALWELQGVMQRLQERVTDRPAPQPAAAQPAPPPAADPFAAAPGKEPTLFGAPTKAPDGDSFFDFFPTEPAVAPTARVDKPAASVFPDPGKNADGFFPDPKRPGGDTLFGAPSVASGQPVARTEPPRREAAPSASRGGLSDLEKPGTLFGDPVPSRPNAKSPSQGKPPPPKPAAVSLSSLEKDPMEAAGQMGSGGFTTYGFKGAGDNRTGIYNPDGNAAAAKAKLRLLLGVAGGVAILAGLAALFIFLRGNAAERAKPAGTPVAVSDESAPAPAAPVGARPKEATGPMATVQTEPRTATPESPADRPAPSAGTENARPQAASGSGTEAAPSAGYSEPPMPVEPARPSSAPEARAPSPKQAPKAAYKGNAHVSPEREAALMALVQGRDWPSSAAERLKDADDLNDLGRTAEANLLYGKALIAEGVSEKQKVSALGGLAVTFQSMGMKAQAKDAVDKILAINPKNGFALKMRSKLE